MNYLLVFGVVVFSSGSGAMVVALLHWARNGQSRTFRPPEVESHFEKWSYK